jgi:diguanylate cyclase (GGDEF)-like protein
LQQAIGGPAARAALATPALPLAAAGRSAAVALLVVGLAVLTALMIWVLERGSGRARGPRAGEQPWDGVRRAAVSAVGEGEQRAAVVEAARGIARADSAQVWAFDADGDLVASEIGGTHLRERRLHLTETLRAELGEDWTGRPSGLVTTLEGLVLTATGSVRGHLEPMLLGGRLVGFLAVGWDTYVTGPGDDARSVLALLAAHAALVVERTELERSARTDALTGLPNRRAFEDELRREMARATRMRVPLTVALLDLDGFKQLNDNAGHAAGDAALRAAADSWTHGLRTMDVLARYGGDEFAVLLPSCSLNEAQEVLDRMRLATPLGLGCSIGLTSWHDGEPAEALIARADTALYASKRSGRNRTTALEPDGEAALRFG